MRERCIVIGSGLGGLTTALTLLRNGYDVTVVEQGAQIGGCLQCFTRSGARFETGMHFIGSALPGQTLHRLLTFFNLDSLPLRQLDTSAYDIVSLGGEQFRFANGREAFIEQMAGYFPAEKDNLSRYFDIIETVASASSLHSLRHAESDFAVNTHYQTVSINSVMDSLFKDPTLKNALVGNLPLYAGEKDKTPFSQHAFITDFYNQSAFRVEGGSDQIARRLASQIEELGGQIMTRSRATRIMCDDVKATGVEINGETLLPADIVISAIHPERTMELLSDTHLLRPAFRKRLSTMRNTTGSFSLFLKFRKNSVPYLNSNFYSFGDSNPWGCGTYTDADWPKGYLYMHHCHGIESGYASSAVVLSYMHFDEVAGWAGTLIGHRGNDYEAFKERKARLLLDSLEKDFPGIGANIEAYWTSTPLTYVDYTATQEGSMYGVAKDITLGMAARVPHKTRIPNLLLTGQNINSHGILGVIVGTIVTCSELLTAEKIYQQILQANKK